MSEGGSGDLVVVDGEIVGPAPGGLVLTGKIAQAYERLERSGWTPEVRDPDDRPDPGVEELERAALAENTVRAYKRWARVYAKYCDAMDRRPVPAAARTLQGFVKFLTVLQPTKGRHAAAGAGMSPASLRQALSAVRALHDLTNQPWPSTKLAHKAIKGHENKRSDVGIADDVGVPPIKLPTLLQLIRSLPADTNAGIRDKAILMVGFVIMARRSELCSLDLEHVTEAGQGGYRIHVPRTKTQRTKGRVAYIPRLPAKDAAICPSRALEAWIERRHSLGILDGPLFRAVDRWDNVCGAPNTPYAGKSTTMRMVGGDIEWIIARAAGAALTAGERIANAALLRPHGLRAGGVTSSYEAGADILSIARQGGWGDRSPVIFKYIREVDMEIRNPMRALFGLAG